MQSDGRLGDPGRLHGVVHLSCRNIAGVYLDDPQLAARSTLKGVSWTFSVVYAISVPSGDQAGLKAALTTDGRDAPHVFTCQSITKIPRRRGSTGTRSARRLATPPARRRPPESSSR